MTVVSEQRYGMHKFLAINQINNDLIHAHISDKKWSEQTPEYFVGVFFLLMLAIQDALRFVDRYSTGPTLSLMTNDYRNAKKPRYFHASIVRPVCTYIHKTKCEAKLQNTLLD